ncbi:MAG TPA: hypothetical protein VJU61_23560 [Polyangiaceae bacterium]|nr:hypothetical protein [Polyangiaceae bacterium]
MSPVELLVVLPAVAGAPVFFAMTGGGMTWGAMALGSMAHCSVALGSMALGSMTCRFFSADVRYRQSDPARQQ